MPKSCNKFKADTNAEISNSNPKVICSAKDKSQFLCNCMTTDSATKFGGLSFYRYMQQVSKLQTMD